VRMEARLAETERLVTLGKLAAEATREMSNPLGSVVANLAAIEQLIHRLKDIVHQLPRDLDRPVEAHLVAEGRATVGDLQETLRDIRAGTDHMTRTLNELRGPRPQERPFGAVDIRQVLVSAIAMTAHEIRSRARLVTEIPPSSPAVRGDEFRLSQLFTNLLVNAAHAIASGNEDSNLIRVTVLPGRANLIVEIRDSGTGMTPDVCSRVFEPVFTADTGLPTCKAIVQEHLGRIEVESEPGQGTTFRVTLPLDRPRPLDEAGERRAGGIRVPPQAMRLTPVPGTRRPG